MERLWGSSSPEILVHLAELTPPHLRIPDTRPRTRRAHRGTPELQARTNLIDAPLAYGTDWLAFAHLLLAALFWGPYRDPVKNIWVIEFGMGASLAVIPLALICGTVRGIPFFWQLIDCSFGLICFPLLWWAHRLIGVHKSKEDRICGPPGN